MKGFRYGGLECGGTKMVAAVCDAAGNVLDTESIPTLGPKETLAEISRFFRDRNIDALGVGAFGPVDLNRASATYGHILSTPKLAWQNVPLLQILQKELKIPVILDTDVNVALYAEVLSGNAKGAHHAAYITVGTGIGVGLWLEDRLYHGTLHSEGGHMRVARYPGDSFSGNCPFHKDCLEGMAAGPALLKRFRETRPEAIWDHSEALEMEAHYLAEAIANLTMLLSLEKVILGGGVCDTPGLIERVRDKTVEKLGGYLPRPDIRHMDTFIMKAALYPKQGIVGAALLGRDASGYSGQ